MPALTNQKHEIFCRKLIEAAKTGKSQGWAYQQSGYDCTTPAADVAATRLLKQAKVVARLTELSEPAARKARTTVDTLAEQFDAVFDGAMGSAQFGAAGSAAAAKSKLLGFMRERVEVGRAGEFDGLQSEAEVLAVIEQELGPQAKALLAAALERRELTPTELRDSYARELLRVATIEQATEALLRVASDQALVVT